MPIKRVSTIFREATTLEQLEQLALRHGVSTGAFGALTKRSEHPPAIVNGGRWLVLCPRCNNGVPCDPAWPSTACIDCGSSYAPTYPQNWEALEAALVDRPTPNQNWVPGETLAMLLEENRSFGGMS